jgi:hypothetical protein
MYNIEWKRDSSGLNSPFCDGERVTGPWSWVEFAERCNMLETALKACWELVPDETEHESIPMIKKTMWPKKEDA